MTSSPVFILSYFVDYTEFSGVSLGDIYFSHRTGKLRLFRRMGCLGVFCVVRILDDVKPLEQGRRTSIQFSLCTGQDSLPISAAPCYDAFCSGICGVLWPTFDESELGYLYPFITDSDVDSKYTVLYNAKWSCVVFVHIVFSLPLFSLDL